MSLALPIATRRTRALILSLLIPAVILVGSCAEDMVEEGGEPNDSQLELREIARLVAPDGDRTFGDSVSVAGDVVVVGTWNYDSSRGENVGAAYVFGRDQGGRDNWGQVARLTASDGATADDFGNSVSVSGEVAIVGAYNDDDWGRNSGSAYIFHRDQGGADNWGQVAKLTASDGAEWDRFGESVSVSGDVAVVGTPYWGGNSGSAYVFGRDEGGRDNWGQVAKLVASDAHETHGFGGSVSVSGDLVVVGEPHHAAYIFRRDQGGADNWGQVAKLTVSDGGYGDNFGYAVAVSADVVVVGAYLNEPVTADIRHNSGSAYVFGRDQGGMDNWGQVAKLLASDTFESHNFGFSVSVYGNVAVIGAQDGGDSSRGAYMFHRDQGGANSWGQVAKLLASDGAPDFGKSVSVSADVAVVGARGIDDAGIDAGAAYVLLTGF